MTQAAGNVTAGKAYCVLEERDGAFSVVYRRNDGGYGILVDKA